MLKGAGFRWLLGMAERKETEKWEWLYRKWYLYSIKKSL